MKKSVVLFGNLSFLGIGDVMQLLGANASTGVLRVISRYAPEPAFIYFVKGNPVNAVNGPQQGLDALYTLFGWQEGEYEFLLEEVKAERVIRKSRMGIILEGLKMVDDGQIEVFGPSDTITRQVSSMYSSELGVDIPILKGPMLDYTYVVDEEDFFDGEIIVEEGKHGNWIWVILEGIVEINKDTKQGRVPILRVTDGSFIGSLASFLMQGNIRTASAVAVGNVQLGVLDSQRLAQEYAKLTPGFRLFLSSLNNRLRQASEAATDLFAKADKTENELKGKQTLIAQGEKYDKLLKIIEGEAVLVRPTDKGKIILARLGKEDFIGTLPFLEMGHEPGNASIVVSKNFQTEPIDVDRLQDEHDQLSTTLKNIIDNVAGSISNTSLVACNYKQKRG
ncbi:MAG: cyclic nucleotide-binding domain-containing protein [Desulfobacteraceae bacterium]|nr:cyclic nucleotide-binding domain-containing protein [Desulfobacteraceae bacterium]